MKNTKNIRGKKLIMNETSFIWKIYTIFATPGGAQKLLLALHLEMTNSWQAWGII